MMNAIEIISQDLFEKIRSRYSNLQMGDENGTVTIDPKDARFFDFDFTHDETNLGRVSISINDTGNLKIFYGRGITENNDESLHEIWYDFLREMRFFSKRRLLRFDTRDIGKGNLDKTDFQYLAKSGAKVSENKNEANNVKESAMYGTTRTSHRTIENTDLIIKHSEAIDPSKPGARSRKIKDLFIQTKEGERFKFPINYLPGARAMQRHVANGGYLHDVSGKKIIEACEEILKLSNFGRKVRNYTLTDSAHAIINQAGAKLKNLRQHMESMSKQRYYETWLENVSINQDNLIEMDEVALESMKAAFTVNKFDESLSEIFPLLHAIMQENSELDLDSYVKESNITNNSIDADSKALESIEISAFKSWTDSMISENLTDDQIAQLNPLIQSPMPVGANGEAEHTLAGIGIMDAKLTDALHALAALPNGADTDTRELLKNYLGSEADKLNWEDGKTTARQLPKVSTQSEIDTSQATQEDESDDSGTTPHEETTGIKKVAQLVMGFYDRDNGTWTRGEQGVVTHVKRQFSNEDGTGGEKEAMLAAKLIQHLNSAYDSRQEFAEMRRLAGLPLLENSKK